MSARKLILAALGASCGLMALPAVSVGFVFSSQLTGSNTPQHEFGKVQGIATDAQGDLYVEAGKRRAAVVVEFSSSGEYLVPQPLTGTTEPLNGSNIVPQGTFGPVLQGLAVDQSTGHLRVYASEKSFVNEFGEAGLFVGQFPGVGAPFTEFTSAEGVAVDSSGSLYVADPLGGLVAKFNATGEFLNTLVSGVEGVWGVAVDNSASASDPSKGDVYVTNVNTATVEKFNASGVSQGAVTIPGGFGFPEGIAVDGQGDVYIADSSKKTVDELSPTGALIAQLTGVPENAGVPHPGEFGEPTRVAVDPQGNLYVTDAGNVVVDEFSPASPPVATAGEAIEVTDSGATLTGSVNPDGGPVSVCRFEYILDSAYQSALAAKAANPYQAGASKPCVAPGGSIGAGRNAVEVTAGLEGLPPHTSYDYRLVALNKAQEASESASQVFTTAILPAVIGEISASHIGQFTATLNGSINPRNTPVSYHFLYATSARYEESKEYENSAPIPDPALAGGETLEPTTPQTIAGLQPGTTYHYALVVSSPAGSEKSPDQTFSTLPVLAPVPSTGASTSPNENSVTLTGSVNPNGSPTAYTFQYNTTGYTGQPCPATGQEWPTIPIALGGLTGSQPVSVLLEGLQPSTLYHYRLLATSIGGTQCGSEATFKTSEYPLSIIQETPSLKTTLGVNLEEPSKKRGKSKKHAKLKRKKKTHSTKKKSSSKTKHGKH